MTDEQRLDLGITLVGALKANAYNCSLEDGIIMALENTELDRIEGTTMEEIFRMPEDSLGRRNIIAVAEREKKILHKQAFALADAAINKIGEILNWPTE